MYIGYVLSSKINEVDINSFVKYTYGFTEYNMKAEDALSRAKSSYSFDVAVNKYHKIFKKAVL